MTQGRGRRATIVDVARQAAVSVGTVSNVLNGTRPVSPQRRAAVMQAIASLGYRPDGVARTLVGRRQRAPARAGAARPRLVVVGYLSVDYVVHLDRVPDAGVRTTAREIRKMLGGPAANVAVFAAGLGGACAPEVDLVTRVGADDESRWAVAALAERGVDAGLAGSARDGSLSRCLVMVDADGARTIVNESSPLTPDDLEAALLAAVSAAPAAVHFDGYHACSGLALAPSLRQAGCRTSVHAAGLAPGTADLDGFLSSFDLVFLDRDGLAALGAPDDGAVQAALDRAGRACDTVVLTAGAGPARLLRSGRAAVQVGPPAVDVADTTGAGDAFAGIFLALSLSGLRNEAAFRAAIDGASLSATALGAQGRVVTAADLGLADSALAEEA